ETLAKEQARTQGNRLASAVAAAPVSVYARPTAAEDTRIVEPARRSIPRFHPVFDLLAAYTGGPEPGFAIDFLGIKTRVEFGSSGSSGLPSTPEGPNEEYFEWICLFDSIMAAKDQYTMMALDRK